MEERGKRNRPQLPAEVTQRYQEESKNRIVDIGERLRQRRELLKLSQENVVRKLHREGLDIARSTYGKYETGEIEMSATVIFVVAKVLQTTVSHLMGDDENLPNRQELAAWVSRLVRLRASIPPALRALWSQSLLDVAEVLAQHERLRTKQAEGEAVV